MTSLQSMVFRSLFVLGFCCAVGHAAAQAPFVPPEFYNSIRPDFGNRLPLCILPESATAKQDNEAASEIARVLLLEPETVEIEADMGMLDEMGIWPVIFEELAQSCVGVMGVQIIPGEVTPDWMTLSRPYFEAPYVLISAEPDIQTLADLPDGTRLGVPLFTPIDAEVMATIESGALGEIRRLPYDRPELMASLMREGELDAAIVWAPHLEASSLQPLDFFEGQGSVAPLRQDTRAVAVLLRQQDQMLRTMIDEAIGALDAGAQP